jgi:hypothetical protein
MTNDTPTTLDSVKRMLASDVGPHRPLRTARVVVRHVNRRRPDGLNYEVLTAPPGEELTLVARMSAGGDAVSYGQTIRDRVATRPNVDSVEFVIPR